MWQRIQTAIVLLIVVCAALFSGSVWAMMALLLVMAAMTSYEFGKLIPKGWSPFFYMGQICFWLALFFVCWSVPSYAFLAKHFMQGSWKVAVVAWCVIIYWVHRYPSKTSWHNKTTLSALAYLLIMAAMTGMFYLWTLSAWWLLYVFGLVWCADSGAYFVGRKLGKRKLAPNVSPNKSIEGLIGGMAIAGIMAVAVGVWLSLPLVALVWFLLLSAATIVLSVYGDLFESMLKRAANVKDSGALLPGHGGVLDRVDSLLAAVPFFAFGVSALGFFGVYFGAKA